jgi:NitT/TauT family transport system permease protein
VVEDAPVRRSGEIIAWGACALLVFGLGWGAWSAGALLTQVPFAPVQAATAPVSWLELLSDAGLTAARVLGALVLGTLWAVPVGIAIGGSQTWSRRLQPVVQVAASFPAPMLFPICLMIFHAIGLPLGVGAMVLMLLGTQWYILFNVIAGSQAIPSELRECSVAFRMDRWPRFWSLEVPAVLPALVTGWITAAGGAWNASIVAEYLSWRGEIHTTGGLGSAISRAAERADYPTLAAAVALMVVLVVVLNATLWKRLGAWTRTRFTIGS